MFYSLSDDAKQKSFVCSHIEEKKTVTLMGDDHKPLPKTQNVSCTYFFTVDGERMRVCKKFFLATLSLSESYASHAIAHCTHGVYTGDQKQKKSPGNKTPIEQIKRTKKHIESFPTVESHCTRKDSKRLYLSSDLNIRKMFELQAKESKEHGHEHVSEKTCQKIFAEDYNLSFHVPKKDQCALCTVTASKKGDGTPTDTKSFQSNMTTSLT